MTDKFTHIPAAYEIVSLEYIDEIKSQAALLRHRKTGARIAVLANDDENKTFNIGFRTPPKDSTGVAHIMEHSVLCGSEKFPAKDPFVELAKGSLNTFLNAMTYPDKTVYPIASCNDADFQNLMHVYLDAVFHPNIYIHDEIFRQEGWHYELTDKDALHLLLIWSMCAQARNAHCVQCGSELRLRQKPKQEKRQKEGISNGRINRTRTHCIPLREIL